MPFRADRRAAAVVPLAALLLSGCLDGDAGPVARLADTAARVTSAGAPAAATPPPAAPVAWPEGDGCRELVPALAGAVAANRVPSSEAGAPVLIMQVDGPPGVALRRDLPLPVAGTAAAKDASCVLLVQSATPLHVEQTSLGRRTVLSEHQSGSRVITNPQYTEAQRLLRQMERAEERSSSGSGGALQSTGEIAMDLLALAGTGVIGGVAALWEHGQKKEARDRLEQVPPTLEQPTYTTYRLSVEDVDASRSAGVRLALVDREAGRIWELRREIEEERVFALADGLHLRDREVAEGRAQWDQPPALHRWRQQPVELTVSEALGWLAAAMRTGEGRKGELAGLVEAWERPEGRQLAARAAPAPLLPASSAPAPTHAALAAPAVVAALPEPAAGPAVLTRMPVAEGPVPPDVTPSLVAVHGMGGQGAGVYVDDKRILTSRSLMGSSSMIEIRTADGEVIYGMLERLDAQHDLALVQVQKQGMPVRIAADGAASEGTPPPGASPGAPGTPLVRGGELVGLLVHEQVGQSIDGSEIAAFLGRSPG
ncbi:hypothetical protein SH611_14055 [Geminicoccaceae bacterium 1502E]|nr:hypothetical protein [Geminicoccaceae bacterium 1502E]